MPAGSCAAGDRRPGGEHRGDQSGRNGDTIGPDSTVFSTPSNISALCAQPRPLCTSSRLEDGWPPQGVDPSEYATADHWLIATAP